MELRIKDLVRRLAWLGYTGFEIGSIIREAIGRDSIDDLGPAQGSRVLRHLQQYERLGSHYLLTYSK